MKSQSLSILFLAAFFSCSPSGNKEQTESTGAKESQESLHEHEVIHEHVEQEEIVDVEGSKLSLNNGEKWKANVAITESIEDMQAAIDDFQSDKEQEVASLQMQLTEEFKTLVSSCTMKGESHEQLHHYILPLKEKIDSLEEGDLEGNLKELQDYLLVYGQYFKSSEELS